ncbi:hypothetical protein BDF19DRAFT_389663, partial [Syncephalis fuscata]
PKGGWESDETKERSAEREAWEEVSYNVYPGVVGRIVKEIGTWSTFRKKKPLKAKSCFTVFELQVDECHDVWPEQSFRKRQWFDVDDVKDAVKHAWMVEAVQQCSAGKAS